MGLTRVAVYRRGVPASLERVWENVLDWEHLPWLHRGTFSSIECAEAGDWGWRARVGLQPADCGRSALIELRLEPALRRYGVRTLEGTGEGTEIWTRLEPVAAERTDVEVEFLVPGVAPESADALGRAYTGLYTRLWDEDEAMMRRRSLLLVRRGAVAGRSRSLDLGPEDELRARLPVVVEGNGQAFRIVSLNGELVAHATGCPHALGPLDCAELEDGWIRCPWHGYRFDLRTGRCADARRLRLPPAPQVEVDPTTSRASLHFARR
ncbi:MAG: Rieske 2Fe-2S domain-containing protein [Myxococcota bacterium]